MQKLLWIGNPYFAGSLAECGWDITIRELRDFRTLCWDELVRMAGFKPDVLVVGDISSPPFVLGMEEFPCLTVFYAVDSHIHSWLPLYAQGFDACLVSLLGDIDKFIGPFLPRERVWWSPPYAKMEDKPAPEIPKSIDCLFVGTNDEKLMPGRTAFLRELAKNVPGLVVTTGNYRELFPKARVLVNHAANGDLNFRVFEALGCGGCLVTPRIGHGLEKMFVDGEHLVGYAPEDAGDAAWRINFLLENPAVCEHIGNTGNAEVNSAHRAIHRAQAFTDHVCDLFMGDVEEIIAQRKRLAPRIRKECLSVPYLLWAKELSQPEIKEAYLAAARGKFGLSGITN